MGNLIEDLKYSIRLLRKTPTFSAACLTVIILGLAVAICNYSLSYEFRKPPPFADGERFVGIRVINTLTGNPENWDYFNAYTLNAISKRQSSFEFIDAVENRIVNLIDEDVASRYYTADITQNLLKNTHTKPLLGRLFNDADYVGVQDRVVILSYKLWQDIFLANPTAIGRTIEIEGQQHSIIGVMPKDFNYPFAQDLWRPRLLKEDEPLDGTERLGIVGKLRPSVSQEAASIEINQIIGQLKEDLPQLLANIEAEVVPNKSLFTGGVRGTRELLSALTLVIFLLASLNLSTLLFTRANQRVQELAIRNAMGANVWQLRKQILLESGLLCLVGFILSLGLSHLVMQGVQATMDALQVIMRADLNMNFGIQLASARYALGMTVAIWITSSFMTAYKVSGANLNQSLEGGSKGGTSRQGAITSRIIVSVEVVFTCFLLILCGLITYSIIGSYQTDFGSETKDLYIGEFALAPDKFPSKISQTQFLTEIGQQIETYPSVESITFTNIPTGGWYWPASYPIGLADRDISRDGNYPEVITGAISANYFRDIGTNLTAGRFFDNGDTALSQPVVIIDQHLADLWWPNDNAIGKQIQLNPKDNGPLLTIVGTNTHIIHGQPLGNTDQRYAIYRPIEQHFIQARTFVVIKTRQQLSMADLFTQTKLAFARVDRNTALDNLVPYGKYISDSFIANKFFAQVAGWFSGVTLLLSIAGVYAIIARSVILRTKEIGIRQAIGASKLKITQLFVGQGITYLFIGVVVGGGSALLTSGALTIVFPNIAQGIPLVSATVVAILGSLIIVASLLPTIKILGIEPGDALRED